jgi:hypothetical protein
MGVLQRGARGPPSPCHFALGGMLVERKVCGLRMAEGAEGDLSRSILEVGLEEEDLSTTVVFDSRGLFCRAEEVMEVSSTCKRRDVAGLPGSSCRVVELGDCAW